MEALVSNLDRLVQDVRLRKAIVECQPTRARLDDAGEGRKVVKLDNVSLHSGRDPVNEAARWAKKFEIGDSIDTVLLFGIGGGYAIEALRERADAELLVFEPNLEVLRVCLESRLIESKRTMIMRDATAIRAYLRDTTKPKGQVMLVAWPPNIRRDKEVLEELSEYVREAMVASLLGENTWNSRLAGWIDNLLVNLPIAMRHPLVGDLEGRFKDVPAFMVAAGPSLEKNVQLLENAKGRGLILTVNTALAALDKRAIQPDIVASIESLDVTEHLIGSPGFASTRFAVDLPGNPKLFRLEPRSMLPFSDMVMYYAKWLKDIGAATPVDSGCCAAHAAFSIARMMGCNPITLVGQDAALTGGEFYAKSTQYGGVSLGKVGDDAGVISYAEDREEELKDSIISYKNGDAVYLHPVQSWGGKGEVQSTPQLDYVRNWYEERCLTWDGLRVINATEGGAHIRGLEEEKLTDVIASLPNQDVDASSIDQHARLADDERFEQVVSGLAKMRKGVSKVEKAARRAIVARAGKEDAALEAMRQAVHGAPLTEGYARAEIRKVGEGRGDLKDLCSVLIRRAGSLASRLKQAEMEIRAVWQDRN